MPNSNIYLSTYAIRLKHRGASISFQNFNGTEDFLDTFANYVTHVSDNGEITHSYAGDLSLHLSIEDDFQKDDSGRKIYGRLSSGISNDKYTVRPSGSREIKFKSDNDDITFRDLFFYLHLPPDKDYGYLILQKKRNLGAKGSLAKSLNQYLRNQGYHAFSVELSNMLDERVYERMITAGRLKRVDFIKKKLPKTIDDVYNGNLEVENKGTTITSIYENDGLGDYWKGLVNTLYKRQYKQKIIEINDNIDDLDEVQFVLELNGKTKTFHVLERGRTQPDIEVSSELVFQDNEPTIASLVETTEGLINELLTLHHNNAQ